MKKNKIVKKPRTIADLKFEWKITREAHKDIEQAQSNFEIQNPHLKGMKIIPNTYFFVFNTHKTEIPVTKTSFCELTELFEYIGYYLSHVFGITGKFSHFERVDDLTYRIHIK